MLGISVVLPVVIVIYQAGCAVFSGFFWDSTGELEAFTAEAEAVTKGAQEEVQLYPKSSKAHAAFAQAIQNQDRYADAEAEWKTALRLNAADHALNDPKGNDIRRVESGIQECEQALKR